MNKKLLLVIGIFGWIAANAITPGWDNVNPNRQEFPPQRVLWIADLSQAKLEAREGAEGQLKVISDNGTNKLQIVKTNAKGYLLVTVPSFKVPLRTKLRVFAACECADGDSEEGGAYLRLWGAKEDLSYYKGLDGRGPGGPRMEKMINTAPGIRIRKLAHRLVDESTGPNITAGIVVSGPASTSIWSGWGVEDLRAAEAGWRNYRKSLEPTEVTFGMMPDDIFNDALAKDCEHTAAIVKEDSCAKLMIDGEVVSPIIFKGQTQKNGRLTYAGGLHDRQGLTLQCVSVRFGRDAKNPLGMWTKDGFEPEIGVDLVRKAMRLASNSTFILQINLSAYPEWVDKHPGEEWMLADGRKVYGGNVHADFSVARKLPKGKWYWPSYHSLVWREETKARITEFISALKASGLAKRIVGVHLSGYHDAQFATRHPDFSPSAVAQFKAWQKQKYGEIKWMEAPTFSNTTHLDPATDQHQIDYLTFVKQGPFHMQEDIARHIRSCFGKNIVIGRYCMGWGAAAFNGALDLDPFVLSKDIDFLVAQPNYAYRTPGVALGSRIPTRSFHEHGKLFVNEFDLRTYGGVHGTESELRVQGLSQATDFQMWQTIHHKLAGQMIAQRMGWWYLDMSGTWFSPPEIVEDIADVYKHASKLEATRKSASEWRPSVAIAIDEAGLLRCNSIAHYYSSDEKNLQEQIRSLTGAGVPSDMWLADDFVRNPELAMAYKVVVFSDFRGQDERRKALLTRLAKAGIKCVFLDPNQRLLPSAYAELVRQAGGYVPTRTGLQVDMNGSFISIHALKGGKYEFILPYECAAYNLKSGELQAKGKKMSLDLLPGETCWFALSF